MPTAPGSSPERDSRPASEPAGRTGRTRWRRRPHRPIPRRRARSPGARNEPVVAGIGRVPGRDRAAWCVRPGAWSPARTARPPAAARLRLGPQVDVGHGGQRRRPGPGVRRRLRRPATRRVGSRASSSSRRLAAGLGPRSTAAGPTRRAAGSSRRARPSPARTRRPSAPNRALPEQIGLPGAADPSTRQSSGLRHQTRSWLGSPSSWARLANESLSGTCRLPEVSRHTRTSHTRGALRSAGPARRRRRWTPRTGRAPIASGVPTSTAAVTSTTSQRALTAPNVGGGLSGPRSFSRNVRSG